MALPGKCKQTSCKVYEDGKCLEGLETKDCPHFYFDSPEENVAQKSSKESKKTNRVQLFSGEELELKDISFITNRYKSKMILIVGETDCGKTTLLATIYDLFQLGPMQDILFSGSSTQVAFERRCHLSRIVSNSHMPQAERTTSKTFNFLHLSIKKKNYLDGPGTNLLLSDISGERFQLARDSSSSMRELELLKFADHVLLIIDGSKLANPKLRTGAVLNTQTFVQKALDENLFTVKTILKIVVSKWDKLEGQAFDITKSIIEPFTKHFESRLKRIEFLKIAARPEEVNDEIQIGFGLYSLLNEWIVIENENIESEIDVEYKTNRYFNKYRCQ